MARPETCVGAIVVDRGRLLLIQRGRGSSKGRWSVPGGRVEFGESLAEAVEREVLEETGLSVVCGSYVGFVELFGADYHYVIHDFTATVRGTADPLMAGDDAADARWVALDVLDEVDLVDGMKHFLVEHGFLPGP